MAEAIRHHAALVRCSCCGEWVTLDEPALAFRWPEPFRRLDADARSAPDTFCDTSFCAIGGEQFYMRGLLPLPVHGLQERYSIGAWVRLERADWQLARRMWDERGNDRLPELDGELANHVPHLFEVSTEGLAVRVRLHDEMRPTFRLIGTGRPLEDEQQHGISAHRALAFSRLPPQR